MGDQHILREESFGGLIIHRDTGRELLLNPTAFLIAKLSLEDELEESAIITYVYENFNVSPETDLAQQVRGVLKDLHEYLIYGRSDHWQSQLIDDSSLQILSSPVSVFWEITFACNLRCRHCYSDSAHPLKNELNTSECRELLKEMADLGVCKIIFGGGEPFVKPDFLELLEYAADLGLNLAVPTNGTLLDLETCHRLVKLPRIQVNVSMYHFLPEEHDWFTGQKGTFEQVNQSIQNLQQAGLSFGVQTMLTEQNMDQLEEFAQYLVGMGATEWNLKTGINLGREVQNEVCLPDQRVRSLEDKLRDLQKKYLHQLPINYQIPLEETRGQVYKTCPEQGQFLNCGPGYRNCGLLPDGRMLACSFLRGEEWISCESVREIGFKKLWDHSPIFEPFRTLNSHQLQDCDTCSLLGDVCNSGCRARAYNECGDFYARDPRCQIER